MRRKFIYILLILFLGATVSGCDKNEPAKESFTTLELSKRYVMLDPAFEPTDQISILSGNGEYRIIYPKRINVGIYKADTGPIEKDYSDDMLTIGIEDNIITIKCPPSSINDSGFTGYFLVKDSDGAKQIFEVEYPLSAGLRDSDAYDKYLAKLLADKKFWQE